MQNYAIIKRVGNDQQTKGANTMTYTIYLFNDEIEKYSKDINIIKRKQMNLGAVITFTCENEALVAEIFAE